MNTPNYSISKSSFLKFEQCTKAFFLYKKHPYLKDKLSIDKELTFNRGHMVGELAQGLFPGGTDVSKLTKNATEAAVLTAELISKGTETIYEATFIYNEVLIMADILHFENNTYTAYEIKSSLKVSEVYLLDACLQYYVLKNSLPGFEDLFLVTLNGEFILNANGDTKGLFKKRSIKKEGEQNLEFFNEKLKTAQLVLERNAIPDIPVGKHCFKPYTCDFFGTCWKDTAKQNSIFDLPMTSKDQLFEWYYSGRRTMEGLKDVEFENKTIERVRDSFLSGKPILHKNKILNFIEAVQEPYAAFDMEIWSPAVPVLTGTKPFQQVPFLFCLQGTYGKSYFLSEHKPDQRKEFARELILQTERYKSLLVYDKTMEEQVINALVALYPELADELNLLKTKIHDISYLFKEFYYYESSFKNNFSLKSITEALKLPVSFDKVRSGLEAMNYYDRLRKETGELEKKMLEDDLVTYCFNDTQGVLLLFAFLKGLDT